MTNRRAIFLPIIPWDTHIETVKKKNGGKIQGASEQLSKKSLEILKIAKFCPLKNFLFIEKLAIPTLKVHSFVLMSDMNTNDVPK